MIMNQSVSFLYEFFFYILFYWVTFRLSEIIKQHQTQKQESLQGLRIHKHFHKQYKKGKDIFDCFSICEEIQYKCSETK